jgi:ATPase subunit of ABC transporter with duplicated ATPase domains
MLIAPVNTLSGGWKMRVLLAQLLVQKADFYLFDEPTNHLDIIAKDWFLHFLKRADFGFLIVCHEKHFLNKLCTKILALDTPAGKFYQGNYDDYCERFEADGLALEAAYVQQQKMIKQKKEAIARFGASASRLSFRRASRRLCISRCLQLNRAATRYSRYKA